MSAILANAHLAAKEGVPHSADFCPDWVIHALEFLEVASALAGMAVIAVGFFGAIWILASGFIQRLKSGEEPSLAATVKTTRLFLGNAILLGLELIIVSDLVHTFLKPYLESLYALALIVVIRTVISFFLGKELEAVKHEEDRERIVTSDS